MSRQTEDNLQRLIALVGDRDRQSMTVAIGTVQNIDEDKRLCEIKVNDDLTLFNCRLNAVLSDYQNRLLIVPQDGSAVAFLTVDGSLTDPIVIACSEIDKVLLKIEDTEININNEKIVMNGGNLGGLIKIEKLTEKLNDLVNAFNNHTHTTTATIGPSSSVGEISTPVAGASAFTSSDYEDKNITH